MSVPAFIDIPEVEQASDLMVYLNKLGADLKTEKENSDFYEDLQEIVDNSDLLWKADKENDTEAAFNSILTLLFMIPPEKAAALVETICKKLSAVKSTDKSVPARLRLLQNFMFGLSETHPLSYKVYCTLVKLAGDTDNIHYVNTSIDKVKIYCKAWQLNFEKTQSLYRILHEALMKCKKSEDATKVMVTLLGMYTEDNASQAREDAQRCIMTSIQDPSCLIFDHLLPLKPVQFLEGESIHKLLTIFVSGNLQDYFQFCKDSKSFMDSSGLSHDDNVKKMRILTFMSLAEGKKEVDFSTVQEKLNVQREDVQQFCIDVIASKKVNGRINEHEEKIIVKYVMPRRFGKPQWQTLRDELVNWRAKLFLMQRNLEAVAGNVAKGKH